MRRSSSSVFRASSADERSGSGAGPYSLLSHAIRSVRVAVAPDSPNVVGSAMGSVLGAPTSVFCRPLAKPNARSGASVRMGGTVARWRPSHPVTIAGQDVFTDCATCADGTLRNGSVVYFPEQQVVVTAKEYGADDDRFANAVLSSALTVDVDANGSTAG